MASENIGSLVSKIYDLIKDLEADEVKKVFDAVSALCGVAVGHTNDNTPAPRTTGSSQTPPNSSDPVSYFASKDPKSKMEELAVAARFRETVRNESKTSKKDFETLFAEARRNFDSANFAFDMRNAKKAGFFVKGGKKTHAHHLSYYGQNFVDALPNRDKALATKSKSRKKKTKATKK